MYAYYCKLCNFFQFSTPKREKELNGVCNCCFEKGFK